MTQYFTQIKTMLGNILLLSDGNVITGLYFEKQKHMPLANPSWQQATHADLFLHVEKQLTEYFQGSRKIFDIPYSLKTATEFQQKVWCVIAKIPYGYALSYQKLATRLGAPQSTRAVANATGRNPISLIIPCHRIIGNNGALVGYAGGLERKQILLEQERKNNIV